MFKVRKISLLEILLKYIVRIYILGIAYIQAGWSLKFIFRLNDVFVADVYK